MTSRVFVCHSLGVAHDLRLHAAVLVHHAVVLLLDVQPDAPQHHPILIVLEQRARQES